MGDYRTDHEVTKAVTDGAMGNPQYWWWKDCTDTSAPGTGWSFTFTAVNPEDYDEEDPEKYPAVEFELDHQKTADLIGRVLAGAFSDPSELPQGTFPEGTPKAQLPPRTVFVSETTVNLCQRLAEDPENGYLSWDDWSVDELLQLAAYGGIVF